MDAKNKQHPDTTLRQDIKVKIARRRDTLAQIELEALMLRDEIDQLEQELELCH